MERSMFIIKSSRLWENIKDLILNWMEKTSGRIYNWTWDKRWKDRDSEKWIREYREWKKKDGR
tara:strand:+ start:432 stop:620 length:189 start_codon:yes stop_codon:yes gene_type:complete